MPATLAQALLGPQTRPHVVADCVALIDREVADTSGVSGAAVRLAYKTVTSFAPGYLRGAVDSLLPQITEQLEPYWAGFADSGGSQFGDYLAKRGGEVTQSVLSVTDARAERSARPAIVKAYRAVRGGAARQVEAALPKVGDLAQKYAA